MNPDDGPGPMDRPRQCDSLAGNMAGQIIGIACGYVWIMRGGVEHNTTGIFWVKLSLLSCLINNKDLTFLIT